MTFDKLSRSESGLLKLPVNVAGENESAIRNAICDRPEDLNRWPGNRLPIEIQPMPIKAPGQSWARSKSVRASDVLKA